MNLFNVIHHFRCVKLITGFGDLRDTQEPFFCPVNPIKRLGMIGCLKVLGKEFTANRQPFFNDQGCFSAGEGISFNCIARIGEFHPKPVIQIANKCLR